MLTRVSMRPELTHRDAESKRQRNRGLRRNPISRPIPALPNQLRNRRLVRSCERHRELRANTGLGTLFGLRYYVASLDRSGGISTVPPTRFTIPNRPLDEDTILCCPSCPRERGRGGASNSGPGACAA